MTIASAALRARTTGSTKPLSIMATGAGRPNADVMNYTNCGSAAGTHIIDGGMKTPIAGIPSETGMTTITTSTESFSSRKIGGSRDFRTILPREMSYP